jgi:ribose transport system substrate-binding protein
MGMFFLILASTLVFAGGQKEGTSTKELRFVCIPKVVHPWYDTVTQGANDAAKFLTEHTGQKVIIDYRAPNVADVVVHNDTIARAIATKPNGIAVAVLDAESNAVQLKESMKHGIPTLIYDSVAPQGMDITVVGCDYVNQGAQMAEELAKSMKYKGQVGVLIGFPSAPNHQLRVEGIKKVIAKYPDMKIVAEGVDNDSIEEATKSAAAIISAHPDINGMVGSNAAGPIGIGIAIKEAGKSGKIAFVGEEDLEQMMEQLKEGIASATSIQRTKQIGYWATMLLWMANQGIKMPPKVDTGSFMITQADVPAYKARQ